MKRTTTQLVYISKKQKKKTYPKLNFNEDPKLAKLDVTDDAGIVSDL